jgi:hypothetical protein
MDTGIHSCSYPEGIPVRSIRARFTAENCIRSAPSGPLERPAPRNLQHQMKPPFSCPSKDYLKNRDEAFNRYRERSGIDFRGSNVSHPQSSPGWYELGFKIMACPGLSRRRRLRDGLVHAQSNSPSKRGVASIGTKPVRETTWLWKVLRKL